MRIVIWITSYEIEVLDFLEVLNGSNLQNWKVKIVSSVMFYGNIQDNIFKTITVLLVTEYINM